MRFVIELDTSRDINVWHEQDCILWINSRGYVITWDISTRHVFVPVYRSILMNRLVRSSGCEYRNCTIVLVLVASLVLL